MEVRAAQDPEDREKDLEPAALRWPRQAGPPGAGGQEPHLGAPLREQKPRGPGVSPGVLRPGRWSRREWMDDPLGQTEGEWKALPQTLGLRAMEDGWELCPRGNQGLRPWSCSRAPGPRARRQDGRHKAAQIQDTTREAIRGVIARAIEGAERGPHRAGAGRAS